MGDDQQQHQGNGYQHGGNYQNNQQQNYQQQNYQQQIYQQQNYQQGYQNQNNNINNWEGQHQQQQQLFNRNYNAPYQGNQQPGRGGGNYGYGNQQQESNDYYGYEGSENFDQDDYENLEAIERAISGNRIQSPSTDQYGEYADEEDRAMAELEEEMHRARPISSTSGNSRGGGGTSSGSYLPAGAVPRQNGVLSVHAKEFWFPESRNCSCCKGFKHGCDCCAGGVDTCAKGDCINAEFATQVATDLASRTPTTTSAPVTHTPPTVRAAITAPAPKASGGSFLPPGAVPRQNGVLSVHAKEFWFPESRNCSCCKGFKHGCDCCAGGVDTCAKGDCINAEFATQVATDLASREVAADNSTSSTSNTAVSVLTPTGYGLMTKTPAAAAPTGHITHTSSGLAGAPATGGPPSDLCKFFASGGCRFGDSCRFKHVGSAVTVPTLPAGVKQICPFFLNSTCQYGDSCRKSHDASAGPISQIAYPLPGPGYH